LSNLPQGLHDWRFQAANQGSRRLGGSRSSVYPNVYPNGGARAVAHPAFVTGELRIDDQRIVPTQSSGHVRLPYAGNSCDGAVRPPTAPRGSWKLPQAAVLRVTTAACDDSNALPFHAAPSPPKGKPMTALPRSWPYPALLLCPALAGCGKSPTPEVPAGAGTSPG
jgi:hypothetical protein